MKVFIVSEGHVVLGECTHGHVPKDGGDPVVCEGFEDSKEREMVRATLLESLDTTHVWFEDEIGTIHDPVLGPNPVYGPRVATMYN
jgi:hypothetical protein